MRGDDAVTGRVLDERTYLRATGLSALGGLDPGTGSGAMPETVLVRADGPVSYDFAVSGDVVPVPTGEIVRDSIGDGRVAGVVTDGFAAYHVTGDVTDVQIDGDGRLDYGRSARETLEDPARVLVATAPPEADYELTATGLVEPLDGGVTVVVNDDQTRTVCCRGSCAVAFGGELVGFETTADDLRVELDGEPRPVWELTGGDRPRHRDLTVTAPTEVRYEFTTTAGIERTTPRAEPLGAGDSVTVSQADDGTWTVRGTVGDGACETFSIYGAVTAFEPERGDFAVLVDGEPISPRSLVATATTPTPVGGGDGSPGAVTALDATATVTTAPELADALDGATAGDVVFVAGGAEIDVATADLRVPDGVTLASDRGLDAASGGLLYTTAGTWPMLAVGDGARVTGLRLGGPHDTFVAYDSDRVGLGLDVVGAGVEIDNCELFGFASAAIRCGADTRVHHSYIHHIPMERVGTAVRCTDGHPEFRYNYVNYTHDGVTATGDGGYTVAGNRFGADVLGHALACDPPGGTTLEIHHNTVAVTDGSGTVALRGEPAQRATVANNWFRTEQTATGAVAQPAAGSWDRIEFVGNRYGTREPSKHIGHPR